MAKRLIFIVEGETEKDFVKEILHPYFFSKNIFDINTFKIKYSGGGLSNYSHLKSDIIKSIYQPNTVVTTLIDFYGLPKDFPKFKEIQNLPTSVEKVDFLEKSIKQDLEQFQKQKFDNFVPYIQLHEFEALVFTSLESIYNNFESNKVNKAEIDKIFREFNNPEEINGNPNTAPSKRLLRNISGYNKIVDGVMIIKNAGLKSVRQRCKRFANWLDTINAKLID
jgi:hypothetical protein